MRRRSLAGPVFLILIGGLFLAYNLRPQIPIFELIAAYWPFLLIAWGVIRLMEAVLGWARREPYRPTFTGGEVALVVLVCLVGSGLYGLDRRGFRFHTQGLEMFGEQYEYGVAGQRAVDNVKTVVVDNPRGNVQITGGDVPEVRVTGRKMVRAFSKADADRADQNTPLDFVVDGDQVTVRTNQDRLGGNQRLSEDLDITVPRGLTVISRGGSGDYDVRDIAGNVEITSDRGDARLSRVGGNARVELQHSDLIRAVDLKGNLDLQGRGTDLDLQNVAGQVTISGSYSGSLDFKNIARPLRFESPNTELHVEALPGEISMDLGEFTARNVVGPVRFVTRSKDVKISGFTDSLDVETERGDIELEASKLPVAKITARSRAGRIELALPDKSTFQLEATAQRGEAENDFGPAIQKETDGRSATLKGKVGEGPSIFLVTERGSVTVKKSGPPAASPSEAKL